MEKRWKTLLMINMGMNLLLIALLITGFTGHNVLTTFNPDIEIPEVAKTAFVHHLASVIGDVHLGERVYVAPSASVRGDEGQPIFIGDESNIQDACVIHGLETLSHEKPVEKHMVEHEGKKFSVYIGKRVSMAHQSQVHGPAKVGDDSFIGMQALVFKATIGNNVVVEPGAILLGVKVPDNRYVPAGSVVTKQEQADALPKITADYPLKDLNKAVVHVNTQLADGYNGRTIGKAASHD